MRSWLKFAALKKKTLLQITMAIAAVAMLLPLVVTSATLAYADGSFTITQDEINPQDGSVRKSQTTTFSGGTTTESNAPNWLDHSFSLAYIVDTNNPKKKIAIKSAVLQGNDVIVTPTEDYDEPDGITLLYPENESKNIHFEYYQSATAIPITYNNNNNNVTVDGPNYAAKSPAMFNVQVSAPRDQEPTLTVDGTDSDATIEKSLDISSPERTAYVFKVEVTKATKLIAGSTPKGQLTLTDSGFQPDDWKFGEPYDIDRQHLTYANTLYSSSTTNFSHGQTVSFDLYHDKVTKGADWTYSVVLAAVWINGIPVPAPQPLARYGENKYQECLYKPPVLGRTDQDYYCNDRPYYSKDGKNDSHFLELNPSYVVGTYSKFFGFGPDDKGGATDVGKYSWQNWYKTQIQPKVIGQKTVTKFTTGPLAGSTVTVEIVDAKNAAQCEPLGVKDPQGRLATCSQTGTRSQDWGYYNSLRFKYHVTIEKPATSLNISTEWARTNNLKVGVRLNQGVDNFYVRATHTGTNNSVITHDKYRPLGQQNWVKIDSSMPDGDWVDGRSLEGSFCDEGYVGYYYNGCIYLSNPNPSLPIKGEVKNGYKNPVYIDGSHSPVQEGKSIAPLTINDNGFEGNYPIFAVGADPVDYNEYLHYLFGGMSIVGVQAERLQIPLGFDLQGGQAPGGDTTKFPTLREIGNRNIQYLLDPEVHRNARVPLATPMKNHQPLKDWKLQYAGSDTGTGFRDTGKTFKPGSLIDVYNPDVVGMRVNTKGGEQKVTAFRLVAEYAEGTNSQDTTSYNVNVQYNDGASSTSEEADTENLLSFTGVKGVTVKIDKSKLPAEKQKHGKRYKRAIQEDQLDNELRVKVGDSNVAKTFVYNVATQADETTPQAQLVTVNIHSMPGETEAKQGINNPDSLKAKKFEWVGKVNTSAATNLLTPAPKIKITYNDNSTDIVDAMVKVVDNRNEATKWKEDHNSNQDLTAQTQTFNYAYTVSADDKKSLITQGNSLPSDAVVSLDSDFDTSPTDTTHYDQQKTLTVTFKDKSTLSVTVNARIKTAAETFNPQKASPEVSVRYKGSLGDDEAKNAVNTSGLPSGTTYSWVTGHKPDTSSAGKKAGQVLVTYPDTTTDTVPVMVNVRASASVTNVPETALPGAQFTPTLNGAESGETYTLKLCKASDTNCANPLVTQTKQASEAFTAVTIPKTETGSVKVVVTDSTNAMLPVNHATITLTPVDITAKSGAAVASTVQAGSTIDAKLKDPAVGEKYVAKLCKQSDTNCANPVATTSGTLNTGSPNINGLTVPVNTANNAASNGMYQLKLYRSSCASQDDTRCAPVVIKSITATVSDVDISNKAHANFAVTKTGATNIANGSDSYTVTITLQDNNGNAVSGKENDLQVSQSGIDSGVSIGTVSPVSGKLGVYTATITSTKAGNGTVAVTYGKQKQALQLKKSASNAVAFVAGLVDLTHSKVEVVDNNKVADGTQTDSYKVTLKDANDNPVVGMSDKLDSSISGISGTSLNRPTDNKDGTYTVTVSSTKAGTASVTVKFKSASTEEGAALTGSPLSLKFVPGEPVKAQLYDSAQQKVADTQSISGQKNTQISAPGKLLITDKNNNPVAQNTHVYIILPGASAPQDVTVGANGLVDIPSFTPSGNGSVDVYKEIGKTTKLGSVPVTVFVGDADLSTNAHSNYMVALTQSGKNVANDVDSYTVTITLKDSSNNPVSGQAANLSIEQSGIESSSVTLSGVSENGSTGVYTATVKSTKSGTGNVTVNLMQKNMKKSVPLAVSASKVVTFVPGEPATVEFTGVPENVTSGTQYCTSSSCSITVKDLQGNVVPANTKVFVTLPGASSPVAVTVTGSNGVATLPEFTPGKVADNKLTVYKAKAGQADMADTSAQGKIGEKSVTVATGPASSLTSTLTLSPSPSPTAFEPVAISGTVKDAASNPLKNHDVTLKLPNGSTLQATTDDTGALMPKTPSTTLQFKAGLPGVQQTVEMHDGTSVDGALLKSASVTPVADPEKSGVPYVNGQDYSKAAISTGDKLADNTQAHTVTVVLKDVYGKPVTGVAEKLSLDTSITALKSALTFSNFTESTEPTEAGTYTATVKSTQPGTPVISVAYRRGESGKQVTIASDLQASFVSGDYDSAHSTLTVTKDQAAVDATHPVVAGSVVKIVFTPKDAQNHVLKSVEGPVTVVVPGIEQPVTLTKQEDGTFTNESVKLTQAGSYDLQSKVVAKSSEQPANGPKAAVKVTSAAAAHATGEAVSTIKGSQVSGHALTVTDEFKNPVASGTIYVKTPGSTQYQAVTVTNGAATVPTFTATDDTPIKVYADNAGKKEIGSVAVSVHIGGVDLANKTHSNYEVALTSADHKVANGKDSYTVTIKLADINGNPIAGRAAADFHIMQSGIESGVTIGAVSESSTQGTYTAKVTSTKAGTGTITVKLTESGSQKDVQLANGKSSQVEFVAGAPAGMQSTLVLSPTDPISESTVEISGVVKDAQGNVVPSHDVTLLLPDGSTLAATTTAQGALQAKAPLMALQFKAGVPRVVQTVKLFDGNSATGNPLKTASVTPRVDPQLAGVPVVKGTERSTASIDDAVLLADGVTTHTVTVVLKDKYGDPVTGVAQKLSLDLSTAGFENALKFGAFVEKSNEHGTYTATVSSTLPGHPVVNVAYERSMQGKQVTIASNLVAKFKTGEYNTATSTLVASKDGETVDATHAVTAGDTVNLVFTPKDAQGHVLSDVAGPVLVTVPGVDQPVQLSKQSDGTFTGSATLTKSGVNDLTSQVTAKADSASVAGPSAQVLVNPSAPSSKTSSVSLTAEKPTAPGSNVPIENTNVVVGGVVKDEHGNVVPEHEVTLVVTDGNGNKHAVDAKTDAHGVLVDRTTGKPVKVAVGDAGTTTTVDVFDGDVDASSIPPEVKPIGSASVESGKDPAKVNVPVFTGKYAAHASVSTGAKRADGKASHTVTVVLKDKYGDPVTGAESKLSLAKVEGIDVSLGAFAVKADTPGTYEALVKSTVVGDAYVNASYTPSSGGAVVIPDRRLLTAFEVGPFDAATTEITVSRSSDSSHAAIHSVTAGVQVMVSVSPKDAQGHARTLEGDPASIEVNVPGVASAVTLTKNEHGVYVGTATPVTVTTSKNNQLTFPENSPLKDRRYELNVVSGSPSAANTAVTFTPLNPKPGEKTSVRITVKDAQGNVVAPGTRVNVEIPGYKVNVPGVTDANGVVHTIGTDGRATSDLPSFTPTHSGPEKVHITMGEAGTRLKDTSIEVRPAAPKDLKANATGVSGAVAAEVPTGSVVIVKNAKGDIVATGEVDKDHHFNLTYDSHAKVAQGEKLQVTVTDAETALTSDAATVTVDKLAPATPSIVLDPNKRTVVSGDVNPAAGTPVTKVTVCVTPKGEKTPHCFEATVKDGHYSADVPELHDGDTVVVTVENAQGNTSSSSRVVDFTAPEPPVVTYVSNKDGSKTVHVHPVDLDELNGKPAVCLMPVEDSANDPANDPAAPASPNVPSSQSASATPECVPVAADKLEGPDDKGDYTFTVPASDLPKPLLVKATVADKSGNVSKPGVTTLPAVVTPEVKNVIASGVQVTGDIDPATPVDSVVTVRDEDGNVIGTGKVVETPSDSSDPDSKPVKSFVVKFDEGKQPADGAKISVTVTDADTKVDSKPVVVVVDAKKPAAPTDVDVSKDGTTISGKGEPGTTVRVTLPDGTVLTGVVDSDGNFTIKVPKGHEVPDKGKVTVVLIDKAGNVSDATVVIADRSNTLKDVKVNKQGTVVSGSTDPGATVTVRDANGKVLGAGVANKDGKFSITVKQLTNNERITVTSVDSHGNMASAKFIFTAPKPKQLSNTGADVSQVFTATVLLTLIGALVALERRKRARAQA